MNSLFNNKETVQELKFKSHLNVVPCLRCITLSTTASAKKSIKDVADTTKIVKFDAERRSGTTVPETVVVRSLI